MTSTSGSLKAAKHPLYGRRLMSACFEKYGLYFAIRSFDI